MINRKIIRIMILVVVLLLGGISAWVISIRRANSETIFISKNGSFNQMSESILIQAAMSGYFDANGQYPPEYNIETLFSLSRDYTDLDTGEVNSLRKTFLIDPMCEVSQSLGYVRIVRNDRICGYILLSAGIDEKLNNIQMQFSSMEDALEGLQVYTSSEFSYLNRLFGKKDLILLKVDSCSE